MLRKILLIIDGLLLGMAIIIGIDYSYYIANIKYVGNNETVILSDIINLNIEDKNIIYDINKENELKFNVENLSDTQTTFNLLFNNIENDFESNLVYELYEKDKISVSKTIAPKTGSNSYIKLNINMNSGEIKEFTLKFEILNKDNVDSKKFKAVLNIDSLKINDSIKTASNYLIAFNPINTNGEIDGLFEEKNNDTGNSVYYFKGNVNNNYVLLNNDLYRIIRINEDGSIRIIKDTNVDVNYQYNFDSKIDNAYDYINSNLKQELDNYYNNNLKNVDNLLIEGNFCTELHAVKNDIYKISDTNVNYNEYTPTSKCNQMNNLKIGLISYDEAVMAGLSYTSFYNNSNYLVNGINKNTWTLSPAGVNSYSNDKFVWKISDNGSVIEANVSSNSNSIRPVINIKSTLNITGNGTIDNPYIFSE